MKLKPGRLPFLRAADVPSRAYLRLRGPIYLANTKHGARIFVAVDVLRGQFDAIDADLVISIAGDSLGSFEWCFDFRSSSYVRLCRRFGDDVTQWTAGALIFVQRVTTKADGRPRLEVIA